MSLAYLKRKLEIRGNTFYPLKEALIFDIETAKKNPNATISPENSIFKIWGSYSYKTNKVSTSRNLSELQTLLNDHKIIVGHNIKYFDIPILKNNGLTFYNNLPIDLLETLRKPPSKQEKEAFKKKNKKPIFGKGRALIIGEARIKGMDDKRFPDFKLGTIMKHGQLLFKDHPIYSQYFGQYKDEDFDYDILNKQIITPEDWEIITKYLRQDIVVTKQLFEFLERYFEPLVYFLPDHDIETLEYVHAPTGKYSYKVICNELGLPEEYSDVVQSKFKGAYVFLPEDERFNEKDGDGYCIDFKSQHPSHQRMMNLFTPAEKCKHKVDGKCPTAHSGDGNIFKLLGTYCACEQGQIEKLLTGWYILRFKYKKEGDPREYTIKILINATYGISSSSVFKSIFYEFTGPDTTRMSEQSTKFMAKWMKDGGYKVVYGDSVAEDSYIYSKKYGRIKIKDYFDLYNTDNKKNAFDNKEISITDDKSLSVDKNGNIKWDNCNYIMRHKTKKDMYRLFITNSEYIDVTKDHSIIIEKDKKLQEIKPSELKIGDKLLWMGNKPNNKSKERENSKLHWLFGYWLADGSYTREDNVNISSGDKEIEDTIKDVCLSLGCNYYKGKNGFDYKINSRKLVKYMKELGFIGYSSTKRIPQYIKDSNLATKKSFLNGYFCGDGTVLSNGYIRASSINIDLLKDVQELLSEFGITSKIITESKQNEYITKDKTYSNGSISKHLIVSKYDNILFKNKIGFKFNRKENKITFAKNKKPNYGDLLNVRIKDIVKLPKTERYVYDLCMQRYSNFIANNILVHNTDSLYLMDPFRDKQRMIEWRNKGIEEIKKVLPFVDEYYGMGIDAEFSNIYFFKDEKTNEYKKKNYIYIYKVFDKEGKFVKNEIKINGLPILKSNAPKLAKVIFTNYLEKEILRTNNIKFEKEFITQLIKHEIDKDFTILRTKIKVNPVLSYSSESSIQAQVSKHYLEGKGGQIKIIKHKRKGYGIGKGKHYCSYEEAKQLNFHEFDLDTVWKVLSPFIKRDKQLSLDTF